MVQLMAGAKGEGKTKRIIDMANQTVKKAEGHIVYVDDDSRHIFDLHYDIRFIATTDYDVFNKDEFYGFICGILSQDRDIEKIFVDGLSNIVKNIKTNEVIDLMEKLVILSKKNDVEILISMNFKTDELPEQLRALMVA